MKMLYRRRKETMFRAVIFVVCLLAGAYQTAFSQGSLSHEPKSVGTATRLSVYGTIIPVVAGGAILLAPKSEHHDFGEGLDGVGFLLGWIGIAGGPGFGHAYAGRWGHLAKGSLFRMVGAVMIIAGIVGPDPSGMGGWGDSDNKDNGDKSPERVWIVIGGAIYLWSTIHDFRTLDRSVERYNRKHEGASVSVSPTYFASENAPGIVVSLNF